MLKPSQLAAIKAADIVTLDTETFSLNPWKYGKILAGLAVLPYDGEAFYLSVRHPGRDSTLDDVSRVIDACRGKTVIMHNAKFDLAVLYQEGFDLSTERVLDTAVLARLVFEDEFSYGLKDLAARYVDPSAKDEERALKQYLYKQRRDFKHVLHEIEKAGYEGTSRDAFESLMGEVERELMDDMDALGISFAPSYGTIPTEVIAPYARRDVELTQALYDGFIPRIMERNLDELLELEVKLTRVLFDMERHGARLDAVHIHEQIKDLKKQAEDKPFILDALL